MIGWRKELALMGFYSCRGTLEALLPRICQSRFLKVRENKKKSSLPPRLQRFLLRSSLSPAFGGTRNDTGGEAVSFSKSELTVSSVKKLALSIEKRKSGDG